MSGQSDWNDGRIARSNDCTLRLLELRILYQTLESGQNDVEDLKKLRTLGRKMEEALGTYYERVDETMTAARAAVRGGVPEQTANALVNLELAKIDEEFGQELAPDVYLTMAEWIWAKERYKARKDFQGNKEAREIVLNVLQALEEAKRVRFVDKLMWIEGEPDPRIAAGRTLEMQPAASNGHESSSEAPLTLEELSRGIRSVQQP